MAEQEMAECIISKKTLPISLLYPVELIRPSIIKTIQQLYPSISIKGYISFEELRKIRSFHVEEMLRKDRGEITSLDEEVISAMESQRLTSENTNIRVEEEMTLGDRLADKLAKFCGSWEFIISFLLVIVGWMMLNILILIHPFDHYPFILLNLILSCLAAIQAPVILMSQNRQSARDKIQSDADYKTNLIAELEIRQINAKFDQFIKKQWERLLEIQQIQIDISEELLQKHHKKEKDL